MPPILIGIISTLVPLLVQEAEKLFGSGSGDKKHDWVLGMVDTMVTGLEKMLPSWIKPEADALKPLVDLAIETALKALGV